MYEKKTTNERRARKKSSKSHTESEKSRFRQKTKNKMIRNRSSSTSEGKKSGTDISERKIELYKKMKKLLENKYKKVTSKQALVGEKVNSERKLTETKIYNATNIPPQSKRILEKTASTTETDSGKAVDEKEPEVLVIKPFRSKEVKVKIEPVKSDQSPISVITQKVTKTKDKPQKVQGEKIQKRKLKKLSPALQSPEKKPLNEEEEKSKKGSAKSKYRISKRLLNLARHKELPNEVKKDITFKPFQVTRRALFCRVGTSNLNSRSSEHSSLTIKNRQQKSPNNNLINETNSQIGLNRKRRRFVKSQKTKGTTPRILELAKPVIRQGPPDILPPEIAFSVNKKSLKARCSRRIIELSYPVLRDEDLQIQVMSQGSIKRRALRAKCSKRIKELAKPLPRRSVEKRENK